MQNVKYHLLNTIAVFTFSYLTAITINQFLKFSFSPSYNNTITKTHVFNSPQRSKNFDEYTAILESGFFKVADDLHSRNNDKSMLSSPENITDLILLGTITGPSSIARALIKKKSEREPKIFKMWSNVYGYRLVRISNTKAYLKSGSDIKLLDMFAPVERSSESRSLARRTSPSSQLVKKSISRAEIQQKVLNNVDNALKGIRAGPYREDGVIKGFKLFRIKPYNILYKFGARPGDVIKRINGHSVDSTQKLVKVWESVKGDSRLTVDIERGGKLVTFDLTISE